MLDCWQKQRTHRPTFASITQTLDNLARQPQLLLPIRNSPTEQVPQDNFHHTPTSSSSSNNHPQQIVLGHTMDSRCGTMGTLSPVAFNTTEQWLSDIKMGRYLGHFKESGLLTAQQVSACALNIRSFYVIVWLKSRYFISFSKSSELAAPQVIWFWIVFIFAMRRHV